MITIHYEIHPIYTNGIKYINAGSFPKDILYLLLVDKHLRLTDNIYKASFFSKKEYEQVISGEKTIMINKKAEKFINQGKPVPVVVFIKEVTE